MNLKKLANTPPWDWPDDAGDTFLATLTNKQAKESDRLIAAELGAEIVAMNDELAEALLTIAGSSDESEELRGKAAIALGPVLEECSLEDFENPEDLPIRQDTFDGIVATVHKLYSDDNVPKEVRRRILEGSVRAPQDWHPDAIKKAYASSDKDWKLSAVFSMAYVQGFDKQILEALKSPDLLIHIYAVKAAGSWELGAAWDHIVELLEDPGTPKELLLAAIDAAASILPAEAGPALVDLTTSPDEDIAEAANEAMMMAASMSGELDEEFDDDEEGEESEWKN